MDYQMKRLKLRMKIMHCHILLFANRAILRMLMMAWDILYGREGL